MDPLVKPEDDEAFLGVDGVFGRRMRLGGMTPLTFVIPDGDPEPILPWMAL
jgi:hypothetical protein